MFNLQGSEIIFILLLALVVLGPEKLPSAIKRFAATYAELRKMGTGFQTELKSALDEPMREMRETAGLIKQNADPSKLIAEAQGTSQIDAERDAERKMRAQEIVAQRKAEQAARSGPTDLTGFDDELAVDEWADPVDDEVQASGDPDSETSAAENTVTDTETTIDTETTTETGTATGTATDDGTANQVGTATDSAAGTAARAANPSDDETVSDVDVARAESANGIHQPEDAPDRPSEDEPHDQDDRRNGTSNESVVNQSDEKPIEARQADEEASA